MRVRILEVDQPSRSFSHGLNHYLISNVSPANALQESNKAPVVPVDIRHSGSRRLVVFTAFDDLSFRTTFDSTFSLLDDGDMFRQKNFKGSMSNGLEEVPKFKKGKGERVAIGIKLARPSNNEFLKESERK